MDRRGDGPDGARSGHNVEMRSDGFFTISCGCLMATRFQMKVRESMGGTASATAVAISRGRSAGEAAHFVKHVRESMRHPELAANLHMPSTLAWRVTVTVDRERRQATENSDKDAGRERILWSAWIRASVTYHREHPFEFDMNWPEVFGWISPDSDSGMFGGNLNWAWPCLDAGETSCYTLLPAGRSVLRRHLSDRMPDGLKI